MTDDLNRQLAFLEEADKLKGVVRANVLMDGSRRENTAEHSWHLALWAMVMAPYAPPGTRIDRAIAMALMHDLVEIDAGDHPIHLPQDLAHIIAKERAAADRLFALLPAAQGRAFRDLWEEFEAQASPTARFLRMLDMTQPLFQELGNAAQGPTDRDIIRAIMTTGRGAELVDSWPAIHRYASALLDGAPVALTADLTARLRFLAEADQLKTVLRATPLHDRSRPENTAEHSWHVALFALTLPAHARTPVDVGQAVRMMILHDLVEIDAGDVPIHAQAARDPGMQTLREARAADRLFGMLPAPDAGAFHTIWSTFEAATTPEAIYAKAIDRTQPVLSNLATGGGSWQDYDVSRDALEDRVGRKVTRGAPAVWAAIAPRVDAWFALCR